MEVTGTMKEEMEGRKEGKNEEKKNRSKRERQCRGNKQGKERSNG